MSAAWYSPDPALLQRLRDRRQELLHAAVARRGDTVNVTDERFPGPGVLTCAECRKPMPVGTPYSHRAEGMTDDTPVEVVICTDCEETP